MHWNRSSWLGLAGAAAIVAVVAWLLFAPQIVAGHR